VIYKYITVGNFSLITSPQNVPLSNNNILEAAVGKSYRVYLSPGTCSCG